MAVNLVRAALDENKAVPATYDGSGNLTVGTDVLAVTRPVTFVGAPELNTAAFTWGQQREYSVLVETSSGLKLVFDPVDNTATTYFGFVRAQSWRSQEGDGEEYARRVGEWPPSTARIPLRYFKLVDVRHVDSIARDGLRASGETVTFYGYSSGTRYVTRDLKIAASSWLGITEDPGELMKPEAGKFATLDILVPEPFRDAYLRDIRAVLQHKYEDSGSTVLSFTPIPPQYIRFEEGMLGKIGQSSAAGKSLVDLGSSGRMTVLRAIG